MAKNPAVLFYTSDFLSGTAFFTDEEKGQYITLLCQQHQLGHLPFGHMTKSLSSPSSIVWSKFIKDENGLYYNIRMDEEKEKRINFCSSRVNNKNGNNQYKKKCGHMTSHMSRHTSSHMDNDNENGDFDTTILNKATVFNFEDIWSKYPKRIGKSGALRHFKATVKTEIDLDNIRIALDNYLKSERVHNGFIQNGSTWFNNWQDWIEFKETVCPTCKGKGKYTSSTGYETICTCPRGNNIRMSKQ